MVRGTGSCDITFCRVRERDRQSVSQRCLSDQEGVYLDTFLRDPENGAQKGFTLCILFLVKLKSFVTQVLIMVACDRFIRRIPDLKGLPKGLTKRSTNHHTMQGEMKCATVHNFAKTWCI